MRFLSEGIGELVLEKLRSSIEVRIAVAFFSPNTETLGALAKIPKLQMIVSEEFTINDPYKLEKLRSSTVRSIPADHADGKLHAKVVIAKLRDGSHWALVGSANLTHQGMFSNQEACVVMESANHEDAKSIRIVEDWFNSLLTNANAIKFDEAKSIFDKRSQYRLEPRPDDAPKDAGYWALKTTSGSTGPEHWSMFWTESVIAIGWEDLKVDPSKVSDEQLRAAIRDTFPHYEKKAVETAASTIRKFVDLKKGATILICRGYSSNQEKNVYIYGLARVTGRFRAERKRKGEWRFKHTAVIQKVDVTLPRDTIASALGKQTLLQTIHALSQASFDRFTKELGVPIEV